MHGVLLAGLAIVAAPRVIIHAGPLVLEVGIHRGGQLFHSVDQLSDWALSCHQQYRQHLGPFSASDEALLAKHAAVRKVRGYGVLDQVFLPPSSLEYCAAATAPRGRPESQSSMRLPYPRTRAA